MNEANDGMTAPEYRMSQHGWMGVQYDQQVWIPCPPVFPDGFDLGSWASGYAELWWRMSGREHGDREVKALAQVLTEMREYAYGHLEMHNGLIHLPDLGIVPLLVSFGVWEAAGDRTTQLRVLTRADDPGAMDSPLVDQFETERLGQGIKTLSYTRKGGTVTGYLNYAWRSEEHATALRMFTGCPDLGRLQRAIPDIEQMAHDVTIIPVDYKYR
ncbi:MAG: hypothetical protein ACRDOI_39715 [Trebonia sp.]